MKKTLSFLLVMLVTCIGTLLAQTVEETALFSSSAQNNPCEAPASPFSTHKINYFAFYGLPDKDYAQIKFQFSAKYQFLNKEAEVKGVKTALFLAYTQKSFWSIGEPSRPFEESNYNPELFIRLKPDLRMGRVVLDRILLSPYENESNGMEGIESRSWDRRSVEFRVGIVPRRPYPKVDSFTPFFAQLDVKIWHAVRYDKQDAYLRSIGSRQNFLDYAGRGELRLKVRNIIPWPWAHWDNQFDLSTRILHAENRHNYGVEFLQKVPGSAFSFYLQHWSGYNESLSRFDRDVSKFYTGLSFCY